MSHDDLNSRSAHLNAGDAPDPLDADTTITRMATWKQGVNSSCTGLSLAQWTLFKVTAFGALGGFLFGYDLALIGGALLVIKDELNLTGWEQEVIVGCAKLGAVFGTFLGGALMQCYGRQLTISLNGLFFVVGPLGMAASNNTLGLSMGRLVIGLGIGISAVVVPAYVAEMAPASYRGAMVSVYEAMLCVGMVMSTMVDFSLRHAPGGWRWMVAAPAVPAVLLVLTLAVLPESPRWLLSRARFTQALAVVHSIRAKHPQVEPGKSTPEVEREFLELWRCMLPQEPVALTAIASSSSSRADPDPSQEDSVRQSVCTVVPLREGSETPQTTNDDGPCEDDEAPYTTAPPPSRPSSPNTSTAGIALDEVLHHCPDAPLDSSTVEIQPISSDPVGSALGHPTQGRVDRDVSAPMAEPLHTSQSSWEDTHADSNIQLHTEEDRTGNSDGAMSKQESAVRHGVPSYEIELLQNILMRSAARDEDVLDTTTLNLSRLVFRVHHQNPETHLGFWGSLSRILGQVASLPGSSESRAFFLSLGLALFNQITASTSIINYAPTILQNMGVESDGKAMLLSGTIGATKLIGVMLGMLLVDSLGRKPLLICGSIGCALTMVVLKIAVAHGMVDLAIAAMCLFLFAYSTSWASGFWVLISEMFSMKHKSAAMSTASAVMFAGGAAADFIFLSMVEGLGSHTYLVFATVATASAIYVLLYLPETKGRNLADVQLLIASHADPFVVLWDRALSRYSRL